MDVESNPGPQRISDLPPSTKEFFNKAKRTKLKLVRYESHHTNFTIYATKDLIPKGLLPKCTPAYLSDNPLFWRKWNENLNNLARKQLQLLLEETHNHIKLLTTLLSNQLEDLRTSVNNHSTYTILTTLIENIAFNLSNNLNSLRTEKLKRMPPTDIKKQQHLTDPNLSSDHEVKRFRCKGSWTPSNGRDIALDTFINAVENEIMTSKPATIHNNLSMEERKALTKLRKRSDIVIKPADKGSGTVIMDYSWYVDECRRQLNDTKYYQK